MAHAYIEETVFYLAACVGAPETTDHVLDSVEEHPVVAWLLFELRGADPEGETFDGKATVEAATVRQAAPGASRGVVDD